MLFDDYSKAAIQVIFLARVEASNVASEMMDTQHVVIGIVRVDPVLLQKLGASFDLDWARKRVAVWHTSGHKVAQSVDLSLTKPLTTALVNAANLAESNGCLQVRTEHLLLALMTTPCHASTMLQESRASIEKLQALVSELQGNQEQPAAPWPVKELG
jgi:ATP-dependent Clp protease ATP-binding subunit ClpA